MSEPSPESVVHSKSAVEYPEIRRILRRHLHQDYGLEFKNAAEAIACAVQSANRDRLVWELEQLRREPSDLVAQVLDDHEVDLSEDVSPQELLVTLLALAKLARA
jgi:hypothetical protein